MNFEMQTGQPLSGIRLKRTKQFLAGFDLNYEPDIEYTVNLINHAGEIVATGSLAGNVLKCTAVSKKYQGEGFLARIISNLVSEAFFNGYTHLFLYTSPQNKAVFSVLGFYEIIRTQQILLMENKRNGIADYVKNLEHGESNQIHGAIVANCNPFTNGHLYLMETAAKQCGVLHVFILSEDKSEFSNDIRYRLVQEGIKHIPNLILHQTSDYLISSATFPTYFLKDKAREGDVRCELDLEIFCRYFAKELHVTKRFVGTEPFCKITNTYNEQMKKLLPQYGIEVIEVQRLQKDGYAVSASEVRRLLKDRQFEKLKKRVPFTTYQYLTNRKSEVG